MSDKMNEAFQRIMKKIEEIEVGHKEHCAELANISIRLQEEAKEINETKKRIQYFETVCIRHSIIQQ